MSATLGQNLEGILLVDKPKGKTSFSLVSRLRRLTSVRKIGHAGTLDPFATGVMVMLIGSKYTKLSSQFLCQDKQYECQLHLGITTDTFDSEGAIQSTHSHIPSQKELEEALTLFQGTIEQTPPMFSAKKLKGKKLYELARQGIVVEREKTTIQVKTTLLSYTYPFVSLSIECSKGTYIRSIAHDLGQALHCGAHASELRRIRSGHFSIQDCLSGSTLFSDTPPSHEILQSYLCNENVSCSSVPRS